MTVDTRYTTLGMVAFLDLLGYSARVLAIQTVDDLKAIERDVRHVQQWFDYAAKDEGVRDVQKMQGKRVLAFSDCLVITVPSFSELAGSEGDFDVQLGEIVALGYAQGRCVMNGVFIRGGADYGLWYKKRDTIISPAMVMAYNLEKCAVVPMIAISDDLRRHFFEHPHRNFYHESYDPVAKYFIEVQLPDGRLLWVIDYLPLFLGEVDGSLTREEKERYRTEDGVGREQLRAAAWRRALRELAIAHKDSILSARAQASDPHVAAKYDWLMQYHNDALRRFFVDPPEEILIGTT